MYSLEEFDKAKTKILRYILYKKRTENEVRTKFKNDIDEEMLEDAIEYLKEAKYIDDEDYIEKTINNFKILKKMSIMELKYKLQAKGLNKDLIEDYIYQNKDGLIEYEISSAEKIIRRKEQEKPEIVTYLMKKECLTPEEMETILNKNSGLSAISGLAPDFREIEEASNTDNEMAKIAIDEFNYAIASYIAKYAVESNGVDYIVFTGGIGENQINIRKGVCEKLKFMGVDIDLEANNMRGEEKIISTPNSKIKVWVIPTNEELMIAKETARLIKE